MIAVLGTGQLGTALEQVFTRTGQAVCVLNRAALDITDPLAVDTVLHQIQPDVVINATAFNRVDDAESQAELAFAVNATAVATLSRTSTALGARFVHVSTNYVFSGDAEGPYREDDLPGPRSVYAASKLAGEYLALCYAPQALVVRTSAVFGSGPVSKAQGNFVTAILRQARAGGPLAVVADQMVRPTYAPDLAEALVALLEQDRSGLIHVANENACSWHAFATAILVGAGLDLTVQATATQDLPARARRPRNGVLDTARLATYGVAIPHWHDALDRYLKALEAR